MRNADCKVSFSRSLSLEMFRRQFVFSTIGIIVPIVVSASISDSDPTWLSGDLFAPDLQLNQEALSSNPVLSPSDQTMSMFEPVQSNSDSDAFFENTPFSLFSTVDNNILSSSNTELDGLDLTSTDAGPISNIFGDIADCSMSDPLSPMRKSRTRRQDNSGSCNIPTSGAGIPSFRLNSDADFPLFRINSGAEGIDSNTPERYPIDDRADRLLKGATANPDNNLYCYWITLGTLPFGVCASSVRAHTTPSGLSLSVPGLAPFPLYTLTHSRLGSYFLPCFPLSLKENSVFQVVPPLVAFC